MKRSELFSLIYEATLEGIKETAYPEGFNVEEFKALPTFAARMRYVKARLPKVAQGSARAVFIADKDTVLKVAMNKKGKAQNEVEVEIGQRADIYPVAYVYDVGDGGTWIEMERATKVTPKLFQQLAGVDLKTFESVLRHHDLKMNGRAFKVDKPSGYDDLVHGDNEFFKSVLNLMADYDIPYDDIIRISSWGVVTRNGQQKLVLVDFGLTRTVWNDYYAR